MNGKQSYGDRYMVIERVGSGGMAEVYRARDELLGREVAVKVLSERFANDRSFVERFRREAQAAANLSHPNIVSLYDYGSDDGSYFIVMEFIEGKPLSDVIATDGPLMPERAAEIASDVARALERAHDAGLVHRDVKPGNIMITSLGQTKVTDFGIVRALGGDSEQTMTQAGMVIGTAAYLSPEQAQGNPVDARSDVYSLGCVLCEMLTGRAPFTGDTPLSIAYKHVREDPVPPSALNPDVPPELDAITMKALAKNPDNRFATASEMREDLQRFLTGQTVAATPYLGDDTMVAPRTGSTTQVLQREELGPPPPEGRRAGFYVLLALLILGLFALLAWLLASNLLDDTPQVRVPRVVGMDVEAARDRLEERGLEADVETRASRKPEDQVIAQEPPAGERIDEGGTVTLIVSRGPRQTKVPEVEGLSLEEARATLKEQRLKVGRIERVPHEEVEEGVVISQNPAADERVDVGSRVDVVVSTGPELVRVPSVVGQSQDDAVGEIEAAGLVATVVTEPSDEEEGVVIAQEPDAGAELEPGDEVVITVSEGPEEREMPDVTGMNGDEAEALLESDYGLVVTQTNANPNDCGAVEPGVVCEQDPPAGTPVAEGDRATLYVMPGAAALPSDFAVAARDKLARLG